MKSGDIDVRSHPLATGASPARRPRSMDKPYFAARFEGGRTVFSD
jgi:hypothetical protein